MYNTWRKKREEGKDGWIKGGRECNHGDFVSFCCTGATWILNYTKYFSYIYLRTTIIIMNNIILDLMVMLVT